MIELTDGQLRSLDKGEPLSLFVEGRECVMLSNGAYERLQKVLDDWDPATIQRHLAEMMADDWNDPAMSVYDE